MMERLQTLKKAGLLAEIETIGDATLILADCLTVLHWLPIFDAVITDPPYGSGYALDPIQRNHASQEWDRQPHPALLRYLELAPVNIVWGGNYYDLPPSRCWLTWHKPDSPPSMADFEMAWTNMDKNARQFTQSIAATNAERVGHPTQKPLQLMKWCIQQAGFPQTILDPFMGSGTTGVAAIEMGCQFVGIEINQKFFDIACQRMANAMRQEHLFAPDVKAMQEALL